MNDNFRKNAITVFRKKLSFKRQERTISCYTNCLMKLFKSVPETMPSKITDGQFESFLYNQLTLGISHSLQNQYVNAIKAYRIEVLNRKPSKLFDQLRPAKKKNLPRPISEAKIKRGFSEIKNVKHKTFCLLLYGCGLRMQELLDLRISHFDHGMLTVVGKGGKHRLVTYDRVIKEVLFLYCRKYHIKDFLFPSYSPSSVRKVVRQYFDCKPHQLRHSFATHMLDHGVSTRAIQVLLGHSSSKTTEIYTLVSKAHLAAGYSPELLIS